MRLNNFAESSLDILVIFHLQVGDYPTELAEREAVLLRIMDLANELNVAFAFPTQTLHVDYPNEATTAAPTAEGTVMGFVGRS